MATLTIRDFDDELRSVLKVRAAQNGRSMEAEVREILSNTLTRPVQSVPLGSRLASRFGSQNLSTTGNSTPGLPSANFGPDEENPSADFEPQRRVEIARPIEF